MAKKRKVIKVTNGQAISIGNDLYYMNGPSHEMGGINVGKNLEVEGGEVMQLNKDNLKVFSAQPILNGISPAEMILGGGNPNKVFNAQERYKDRNNLNDDGSIKSPSTGGQDKARLGIWDEIDKYADVGEKILAIPNAAASTATLMAPNPYTAAASYITGLAGTGLDLYQGVRGAIKGDWGTVGKNVIDIGTSLIGLRALRNAKKFRNLDNILRETNAPREYITKTIGRGKSRKKHTTTKEIDNAINNEAIGYTTIPGSVGLSLIDTNINNKNMKTTNNKNKTKYKCGGRTKRAELGTEIPPIYEFQRRIYSDPRFKGYTRHGYYSGGKGGGAGAGMNFGTDSKEITRTVNDTIYIPLVEDFNTAFGRAKQRGDSTFVFNDKLYNTKVGNNPKNIEAGKLRLQNIGVLPISYEKEKTEIIPAKPYKIKKEYGGLSRSKDYGSKNKPYPNIKSSDFAGRGRSYPIPTKADAIDALKLAGLHGRNDVKTKVYKKYPELKKTNGGIITVNGNVNGNIPTTNIRITKFPKIKQAGITIPKTDLSTIKLKPIKPYMPQSSTGEQNRKINNAITDAAGLTSNIIGSAFSFANTKRALKNMQEPTEPIYEQAQKLNTTYNINPQLSDITERTKQMMDIIGANTASGRARIQMMQRSLNQATGARNQLRGQKENIETQLKNADIMNRQSVNARNIAARNAWQNNIINFRNNIKEQLASNRNNLVTGINAGVQDMLSRIENRRNYNNTLGIYAASHPNVDRRLFEKYGVRF